MRRVAAVLVCAGVLAASCSVSESEVESSGGSADARVTETAAAQEPAQAATATTTGAAEPLDADGPDPSTEADDPAVPDASEQTPQQWVETMLSAEPASVVVEVDESGTATAEVGPAGGTVTATAADGTSYELTIPEGALFTTETISATPITGATGEAIGDAAVVGVRLEPDGLSFIAPASLTISGPGLPDDAVGWTSRSDGSDFALTVSNDGADAGSPGSVTIPLTHFSDWGAASPELVALAQDYGISEVGRLAYHALEVAIAAPAEPTFTLALAAFAGWGTALSGALEAVDYAPDLELASVEILGILVLAQNYPEGSVDERQAQSITDALTELVDAWLQQVEAEVERLVDRCAQEGPEIGLRALRWGAIVSEMATVPAAMTLTSDFATTQRKAADAMRGCLVFRVVWEPAVTISDDEGSVKTSAIAQSPPIGVVGGSPEGSGVAVGVSMGNPFDIVDIDASFTLPCEFALETGRATLGWTLVPEWGAPGAGNEPTISGMWAIAGDDEPLFASCAGQDFSFNFFSAEMEILNSRRLNAQGYFEFPLEIVREGEVFARTTTSDRSTVGSSALLEQTVTVIAVPPDG